MNVQEKYEISDECYKLADKVRSGNATAREVWEFLERVGNEFRVEANSSVMGGVE